MVLRLAEAFSMTKSHTILAYGDQSLNIPAGCRRELEEDSGAWDIIRGWCGVAGVEAFDELLDLRADYERLQRRANRCRFPRSRNDWRYRAQPFQ